MKFEKFLCSRIRTLAVFMLIFGGYGLVYYAYKYTNNRVYTVRLSFELPSKSPINGNYLSDLYKANNVLDDWGFYQKISSTTSDNCPGCFNVESLSPGFIRELVKLHSPMSPAPLVKSYKVSLELPNNILSSSSSMPQSSGYLKEVLGDSHPVSCFTNVFIDEFLVRTNLDGSALSDGVEASRSDSSRSWHLLHEPYITVKKVGRNIIYFVLAYTLFGAMVGLSYIYVIFLYQEGK